MRSKSGGSLAILAIAAVGTLVLTGSRTVAVEAVYPVERAKRFVARLFCNSENLRLQREVASLSLLRGDVERLEAENARLRRALDYVAKTPEMWLAAGVLSSDGGAASVRNTLRTDKGSLAGVKVGAIVVVPEGLVGRVITVTPHTSEVLLVTDPSLKVACEVEDGAESSRAARKRGILSGGNEDVLVLRHLSGVGKALPGARVLTSGRGGVFPRGIEVGTLLTNGEVQPHVEYSSLEDVFIRREK